MEMEWVRRAIDLCLLYPNITQEIIKKEFSQLEKEFLEYTKEEKDNIRTFILSKLQVNDI